MTGANGPGRRKDVSWAPFGPSAIPRPVRPPARSQFKGPSAVRRKSRGSLAASTSKAKLAGLRRQEFGPSVSLRSEGVAPSYPELPAVGSERSVYTLDTVRSLISGSHLRSKGVSLRECKIFKECKGGENREKDSLCPVFHPRGTKKGKFVKKS